MTSLALPHCAKRVRAFQARLQASRDSIAGMPAALRLSAHRTHRNAMRVGLNRLIDALHQDANVLPSISAQRLRLEEVAYELAMVGADDIALEAQARQTRGIRKLAALEAASSRMHDLVGGWAEVLEDPLAALRRRQTKEA